MCLTLVKTLNPEKIFLRPGNIGDKPRRMESVTLVIFRNCAWKVIEPKRMVKLFSGIAHSSCGKDTALQTSRKRVLTVSKAFVTPVMLPAINSVLLQ